MIAHPCQHIELSYFHFFLFLTYFIAFIQFGIMILPTRNNVENQLISSHWNRKIHKTNIKKDSNK
jgi:hypothetical protein